MEKLHVMVDFDGYFADGGKYIFTELVYYDFFNQIFKSEKFHFDNQLRPRIRYIHGRLLPLKPLLPQNHVPFILYSMLDASVDYVNVKKSNGRKPQKAILYVRNSRTEHQLRQLFYNFTGCSGEIVNIDSIPCPSFYYLTRSRGFQVSLSAQNQTIVCGNWLKQYLC